MELLLFLMIFVAHHMELNAGKQKCANTYDKLVQGRAFPGFGFNLTEIAVNTTVPHVYGCRHLCKHDPGCVALNFLGSQDARPNCFLIDWKLKVPTLSKQTASLVIVLVQKHCEKAFEANGGWSEWFYDTPCPDACYNLNVTQRRKCLKPYEECDQEFCTGNEVERQHSCYPESFADYRNAINQEGVCFGAKDDSFGSFTFYPCTGLYRVKLQHLSGGVSCVRSPQIYPFGCKAVGKGSKVSITEENNELVLGSNALSLADGDASNVTFIATHDCFHFTKGQNYKLWYNEDLRNVSEIDNHGTSCVQILASNGDC